MSHPILPMIFFVLAYFILWLSTFQFILPIIFHVSFHLAHAIVCFSLFHPIWLSIFQLILPIILDICQSSQLSQSCQHGGYQDPKDCTRCRCPDGWSGSYCETLAPPQKGRAHIIHLLLIIIVIKNICQHSPHLHQHDRDQYCRRQQ